MAREKKSAAPKGKAAKKKSQPKKREPPKEKSSKKSSAMVVRRNESAMRVRDTRASRITHEPEPTTEEEARTPIVERISDMSGSHVASGVGAGAAGAALAVAAVGQGWLGPKTSAGILMGAGVVTIGAGWYWEWDHMMSMGAGLTAAGTFSLANQLSVDGYRAMEKRAQEKRAKAEAEKEEKEHQKRVADARALIQAEEKKKRNARRIVLVDQDDESADDPAHAAA